MALGDMDGDGDLDLVVGNRGQVNQLFLNSGPSNLWNGVAGIDISTDAYNTGVVAVADVNGDGNLDVVAGSYD